MKSKEEVLEGLKRLKDGFVNSMKSELEAYEKQIKSNYEYLINKVDEVINEIESGDVEGVVSLLCYKNLGFCCGTEKACPFRDFVLLVLDIDKEEFEDLKRKFGDMLVTEDGRKKLKEFFEG